MSKPLTKAQVESLLSEALFQTFRASGVEYTCAAAVLGVIRQESESFARKAQAGGHRITARRLQNLALEKVHSS